MYSCYTASVEFYEACNEIPEVNLLVSTIEHKLYKLRNLKLKLK
jgi:hypothetical protein